MPPHHTVSSSPETSSSYVAPPAPPPPAPPASQHNATLKLRLVAPTDGQQQLVDSEHTDERLSDCSCAGNSFECLSQHLPDHHHHHVRPSDSELSQRLSAPPPLPQPQMSSQTLPSYHRQQRQFAGAAAAPPPPPPPAQRSMLAPHLSLPAALPVPPVLAPPGKQRLSTAASLSTCSLSPPPPPQATQSVQSGPPLLARQVTYTATPDTITDASLDVSVEASQQQQQAGFATKQTTSNSQATNSDSINNNNNNRRHPVAAATPHSNPAANTPSRSVRIACDERCSSSTRDRHQQSGFSNPARNLFEGHPQQQQANTSRDGSFSASGQPDQGQQRELSSGGHATPRHSNKHRQGRLPHENEADQQQQRFNQNRNSKNHEQSAASAALKGQAAQASSLAPNNNGNNAAGINNRGKNFIRYGGPSQSANRQHLHSAATTSSASNHTTTGTYHPSPLLAGQAGSTLPAIRQAGHLVAATGSPHFASDPSQHSPGPPASALLPPMGSPLPPMPPLAITSHRTNSPWMRISSIILTPIGIIIVLFIVVSPLLHYLM